MAPEMDSRSGYSESTRTYHTLRPRVTLPSPTQPLSLPDYVSHLSPATSLSKPFLITTGHVITYSDFFANTKSLSLSIQKLYPTLAKNDVAFVLSPTSAHVPLLYFSLLYLGITVCPANPVATESELSHMVRLVKPVIAFATSSVLDKLPEFPLGTVVIDSQRFQAMTSYQPYPDEEAGQIPMAFIVRKPGSRITAVQIMDFIANQVSPYKKIRRVAFINSIPKSPAGKILRRELVNYAVSGVSSKL